MKKFFWISILVLAIFAWETSVATATIIVNVNGVSYTSSNMNEMRRYDFINSSNSSWDWNENKINIVDFILSERLYDLQGRLSAGDHTFTLLNGSTSNFSGTWFGSGMESILVNEISGYNEKNAFGYYTKTAQNGLTTLEETEIFSGSDNYKTPKESLALSPAQAFGFYFDVPESENTYYTETSDNVDGEIHAAIFRVDDSNTYVIGFEDLRLPNTDADYQDMIVSVTVKPVPEPATLLLLGLGLIGLAGARKKFKK